MSLRTSTKMLACERLSLFKAVVNDVLRHGLLTGEKPPARREPFRVASAARGFLPGIDPLKLNQLVDELEVDRFADQQHDRTTR